MTRRSASVFISAMLLFLFAEQTKTQGIVGPSNHQIKYGPTNPRTPQDFFDPLAKSVRTLYIEDGAVEDRIPAWRSNMYKAGSCSYLSFQKQFPATYYLAGSNGKKYSAVKLVERQGFG